MKNLLVLCCLSWLFPLEIAQSVPFKAVNLGAWLVAESWMNPSPFQDIINNDLLDGNQVQFKSTKHNKYLSAENGGGAGLVANRPSASGWETFRLWRIDESSFNFRVFNKQFIGLDNQGINVVAVSNTPDTTETFQFLRNNDKVRIKASNGQFLQVYYVLLVLNYTKFVGEMVYVNSVFSSCHKYFGQVNLFFANLVVNQVQRVIRSFSAQMPYYCSHNLLFLMADENPSVFRMEIIKKLGGEYQLTNGYGPDKAPQKMRV